MKAFIFDLVNKLQRTSNTLDAKAILCNKTWRVFSDTGEKEVYIFMEDGKLVISMNGSVDMGTWMYVPANQSLVITGKQNYLVHPVICNNILALIVDGTNQCAFLLDDTKRELESVKSLQNISSYISSNMNILPQIKASSKTFQTASNLSFIQNQGDNFAFGQFGEQDGCAYHIDLRQLKRICGEFVYAKFSCDFFNPSEYFIVCAYSSDSNNDKWGFTFRIELLEGKLEGIDYCSKKTNAWAHIYIFEKSLFGLNKKYKKEVNYYKPKSAELLDERIWFDRYGEDLRGDIDRYKSELSSILGISDIYGLFVREKYQIW